MSARNCRANRRQGCTKENSGVPNGGRDIPPVRHFRGCSQRHACKSFRTFQTGFTASVKRPDGFKNPSGGRDRQDVLNAVKRIIGKAMRLLRRHILRRASPFWPRFDLLSGGRALFRLQSMAGTFQSRIAIPAHLASRMASPLHGLPGGPAAGTGQSHNRAVDLSTAHQQSLLIQQHINTVF
jgi:hypothetical protein